MLYPIKPGCFRPRAGGVSNIHIQYCYTSKQQTLLDTGIQIPVSCWDKKELKITRSLPPEIGNVKELNIRLTSRDGMLRKETVEKGTMDLIHKLMKDEKLSSFNLVGGTALSLKIGHRKCIDIDFFTTSDFNRLPRCFSHTTRLNIGNRSGK
jgi:hypothetical protein